MQSNVLVEERVPLGSCIASKRDSGPMLIGGSVLMAGDLITV